MGNKTYLSQSVDLTLLRYLWNWKVATTSGLHRKLFPQISCAAAFHRLYRMERAGYIQSQVDATGKHYIWLLTRKGFSIVKSELPPLKEDGFRSEHPAHDLLVSSIHLGSRPFSEPDVSVFTEQQLRRYEPEFYPPWVPKNTSHVPDGYWSRNVPAPHTIALEVELSQKGRAEYEKAARFYDNHSEITKVLWIVRRNALAETIQRAIQRATDGNTVHSFACARDAIAKGWQASLFAGPDSGKTLESLLAKPVQNSDKDLCTVFALDTRKSLYKPAGSHESILERFSHWVGV